MKIINGRKGETFKIISENKTVYASKEQGSLFDELVSLLTEGEREVLPFFIEHDNDCPFGDYPVNKSKAVCDDSDIFNEKIGMEIASAKLDKKEHLRRARIYNRALIYMESLMRKLEHMCDIHLKKAKAIQDDLDRHYCDGGKKR